MNKSFALKVAVALISSAYLANAVSASNIYRSVDKDGVVTFTDAPSKNSALVYTETETPKRTQTPATTTQPVAPAPSSPSRTYMDNQPATVASVPYNVNPSWPNNIHYQANVIEFANANTLGDFLTKWKNNTPIVVAHFGDSHVQPGWQIVTLRQMLQKIKGNGGRGMIFPYAIAKTYSQEDYKSAFTGKWFTANSMQQPPKIALGISGFVAKTADAQASVQFNFAESKPVLGNIHAQLIFKAVNGNYLITISNGTVTQTIPVSSSSDGRSQQISADLPDTQRNVQINISKQNSDTASEFEFHGLNLTNSTGDGLIYHNLGVGGAAFNALLQQKLFDEQFPLLHADLVILDWGTNNILYTNTIAPDFENTVRRTIQRIRAINPRAAILLTSPQGPRYHRKVVTVAAEMSHLMRQIASEEGTLYYDWYTISGAEDSVKQWSTLGYASSDSIHLNAKGYRIRGEMLANALIQAVESSTR